jgi:hypothetical protein
MMSILKDEDGRMKDEKAKMGVGEERRKWKSALTLL